MTQASIDNTESPSSKLKAEIFKTISKRSDERKIDLSSQETDNNTTLCNSNSDLQQCINILKEGVASDYGIYNFFSGAVYNNKLQECHFEEILASNISKTSESADEIISQISIFSTSEKPLKQIYEKKIEPLIPIVTDMDNDQLFNFSVKIFDMLRNELTWGSLLPGMIKAFETGFDEAIKRVGNDEKKSFNLTRVFKLSLSFLACEERIIDHNESERIRMKYAPQLKQIEDSSWPVYFYEIDNLVGKDLGLQIRSESEK